MSGIHPSLRLLRPFAATVTIAVLAVACLNTNEDKVLSISATGTVQGQVYLDANGNLTFDASEPGLPGIGVRLLVRGTPDTIARAATTADGIFRLSRVAVGVYDITLDPSSLGDSGQVVNVDPSLIDVRPDDSVSVTIAVSFAQLTVSEARALPIGETAFVKGIALTGRDIFGDSTLHLADVTAAIRAARARTVTVADGGRLDAALMRVLNPTINDTLTDAADFILTVDDGSGSLDVRLDQEVAFGALDPFVPNSVIDATGVLVPRAANDWVLMPRSEADLTLK